ncbi:MAG TPA: ATP-binding protein [Ilumatobacteraceae bacterium]|nr:ATP-binding protein [Ilumatobacteraceae bacterium]
MDDAPGHGPAWFDFGRTLLVAAATTDEERPDVEQVRIRFAASLDGDDAFSVLVANAGLQLVDAEALAVLATAEVDVDGGRLVDALQGAGHASRITLGTLGRVLGVHRHGALSVAPNAPLCRTAFVEVGTNEPWANLPVALHRSVIWSLLGDSAPDPEMPVGVVVHDADGDHAGNEHAEGADLVVVTGPDRMRRRHLGAATAAGGRFLCVTAPATDAEWAALVREATITGRGVLVEIDDEVSAVMRRWLERASHLVWVLSAKTSPPIEELPDRSWREVHAEPTEPTDAEWAVAFGDSAERTHRLTFDQLHRVQRTRAAVGGDIDAAVRRLAGGPLERLTRRISPRHSWDDIVLSPDRLALLRSVVERYRHANEVYDDWGFSPNPSRGLVALFAGPSGTGKTLASEIIAGALGLDVFKLDLSSVVSKYIGETEKNLEQIFDAASAGNMVLFFDEADSLFGKRSEVRDARDRYANIEVSYLLQRLEAYDGLVIMATNFEKNVDEAFLRRIHVRVEFALPGVEERRAIWATNLPAGAPVDGVDLDVLASRFELSGASIRNAAIHAAFIASAARTRITMETAVLGVAREYRKMGRLLKEKDFGEFFDLVAE